MQEDYTAELRNENKTVNGIYELLESLVFAIICVIFIFAFVARLSIVSGASMEPTLQDADYLIVGNLFSSYEPKSGDIVVIHTDKYDEPLVKRVIATEGQEVKIRYSADLGRMGGNLYEVYVDGVLLEENYVVYSNRYYFIAPSAEIMNITREGNICTAVATVPENCVFVLGDNRNNSYDSRSGKIGFVEEEFVLGKCIFRVMPFQKIGRLK